MTDAEKVRMMIPDTSYQAYKKEKSESWDDIPSFPQWIRDNITRAFEATSGELSRLRTENERLQRELYTAKDSLKDLKDDFREGIGQTADLKDEITMLRGIIHRTRSALTYLPLTQETRRTLEFLLEIPEIRKI